MPPRHAGRLAEAPAATASPLLPLWTSPFRVSLGPGSQGQLHDPSQFLAARAADRLDRHAPKERYDVAGEVAGVRVGRQVAFRQGALEAAAHRSLARRPARDEFPADGFA